MSAPTPTTSPSKGVRILLIFLGLLFIASWIAAHVVWASMSLMGSLMANDSGGATTNQHMGLIFGMLGGQLVAAAAGIPGGLAFFWRSQRKRLLMTFAALFVLGALWQVIAFFSFFS
jgi:hypothetical protein